MVDMHFHTTQCALILLDHLGVVSEGIGWVIYGWNNGTQLCWVNKLMTLDNISWSFLQPFMSFTTFPYLYIGLD